MNVCQMVKAQANKQERKKVVKDIVNLCADIADWIG
jgi:hypothetical protein